ncbi:Lipoprotein LipO precursor [compost metagenome]
MLRNHTKRMSTMIHKPALSSTVVISLMLLLTGCDSSMNATLHGINPGTDTKPVHIVINSLGMKFPSGMDENNNPYIQYTQKKTNLAIKVTLPPLEVYEEKLNVMMSSGNLPDMLHTFNPVWVDNYMKQGALMPLEDLIEQYGPELKKKIPKALWDRVSYEGHIYAIPSINEVKGIEIMYARKDWLDRLGLKPPETLEEYYEVIRAFTKDDPDGNGIDDTIGLIMMESLFRSAPFFGAFGTQLDSWVLRDGKLVNGSVIPETKKALSYLNRLYKEKLLDQEFPMNRINNLDEKIENGTVGLFSAAWYDTRGPIAANKRKDPKAEWIALSYPTGPDGSKGVYDKNIIRGYNVIPVGATNPEGVIRLLNFIAGDEGYKNLKFGFENEIWTMQDGKMVTDFAEHDKHLYRGIYQSLVDVEDHELFKQRLDSLGDFHLYDNLMMIEQNLIKNKFFGSPTPAMSRIKTIMDDLNDKFIRIVMGIEPLDSFDLFVKQWMDEGGKDITTEVNMWYRDQDSTAGGAR